MSKQIYINIIAKDLSKSTAFYEAIGCLKDPRFSDQNASSLAWSENIIFMLLTEDFALNFSDGKKITDQKNSVSALYCLSCDSKEGVDKFCENATKAGGRVYENKFNKENAGDFMYGFEVEDLDGYILEPMFMDLSKIPQS